MTSLTAATLDIVDRYWAADLGCSRADLRSPSTHVVPHADALADYRGVFMLLMVPRGRRQRYVSAGRVG
jgi:hypothetical protein